MGTTGDGQAGFNIDLHRNMVRVEGWGFWPEEVASGLDKALADFCRGNDHGGVLEIDFVRLKPMRQEGQDAFLRLLEALPALGLNKVRVKAGSDLTRLQLIRLVGISGKKEAVQITQQR